MFSDRDRDSELCRESVTTLVERNKTTKAKETLIITLKAAGSLALQFQWKP